MNLVRSTDQETCRQGGEQCDHSPYGSPELRKTIFGDFLFLFFFLWIIKYTNNSKWNWNVDGLENDKITRADVFGCSTTADRAGNSRIHSCTLRPSHTVLTKTISTRTRTRSRSVTVTAMTAVTTTTMTRANPPTKNPTDRATWASQPKLYSLICDLSCCHVNNSGFQQYLYGPFPHDISSPRNRINKTWYVGTYHGINFTPSSQA